MESLQTLRAFGNELGRNIRLRTYPIAIKLLKNKAEIPNGSIRPVNDLRHRILLCQGYAMSRKEGKTVAMFTEDMLCFEPIIGYGWANPPQYFLDGHNRFPQDVNTLGAGKNYAKDLPKLENGKYKGVVSAPLESTSFLPDVVLIYCDSAQLGLLLLGREYKNGHDLKCHLSSHAGCVYSLVPAIKNNQCHVAMPCRGDRYSAIAGDEEIIFSIPLEKLELLIEGLRYVARSGSSMPGKHQMKREPDLPESYQKVLDMLQR